MTHRASPYPRGLSALLVLALGLFWAALPPAAATRAASLEEAGLVWEGPLTVVEVIDGDTVVLDDGRQVRLVGIQAPKLPLGRPDFDPWPLADEARTALERLVLDRPVRLGYGGRQVDRHRRALAHLVLADGADAGSWAQGEMLASGLARVYSFPDNRALVGEMLAAERSARAAGRGIWSDPWYRILTAADLEREPFARLDSFQLVEGRVVAAAIVGKRGYLNFGDDWKSDFTVSVDAATLRLFDEAGLPLPALEGRRVRVRGWVKSWNGPMIDATHPEQIEVLEE
jgi:endonuclease YncB( thermonuclease family)